MSPITQQVFDWAEERREDAPTDPSPSQSAILPSAAPEQTSPFRELRPPLGDDLPIAKPLPRAIEQGVFGTTIEGPMEPDDEEVRGLTEEHARELMVLLADLQAVEDALRTGEDPRTAKKPKTPEAEAKLREFLGREAPRLASAYASALTAYGDAFGSDSAAKLDLWVRKTVADCIVAPSNRYDPGHPWHYYHEGDNAPPIPVEEIEGDIDIGKYIERELPKNPAKRAVRLRELLARERERVVVDKRRYQEIVDKGAEALSRYDREIAHTSDEMARATALSLKYNHICYGLGRVAWLEKALGLDPKIPSVVPD